MSFVEAALIICALVAVLLALACHHLLGRIDLLERATQGGLAPPTRRLAREEFEHRFARALARSRLAAEVEHGVVLVVGGEFPASELATTIRSLDRGEGITIMTDDPLAASAATSLDVPGLVVAGSIAAELAVGVTPFAIVIDDRRVLEARPLSSVDDLVSLLQRTS